MNAFRWKAAAGLLVAFSVGVSLGLVTWEVKSRQPSDDRAAFRAAGFDPVGRDPSDPTQPLLVPGERVSLSDALEQAPMLLMRPQHELASDSSLTEVWVANEGGFREVGFRCASGLRAYLSVWPPASDPMAFYESLVKDTGAGSVVTISGNPAWVSAANSQADGFPAHSVVDMTVGGIEISLQGDFRAATLLEVAESVDTGAVARG